MRIQDLLDIASAGNGYITSSEVTNAGIPRRKLSEAIDKGVLIQLDRGLYALPDIWEDHIFIT